MHLGNEHSGAAVEVSGGMTGLLHAQECGLLDLIRAEVIA